MSRYCVAAFAKGKTIVSMLRFVSKYLVIVVSRKYKVDGALTELVHDD